MKFKLKLKKKLVYSNKLKYNKLKIKMMRN